MTVMVDKQLNCSEDGHNNKGRQEIEYTESACRAIHTDNSSSRGLSRRYVQMGHRSLSIRESDV